MGEEVKVIAAPRGGWLKGLMLFVLTVSAVTLAADRINEAVIRWRYEQFLQAEFDSRFFVKSNLTEEQKNKAGAEYHAIWERYAFSFRSRGLRHPKEWY